MNLVIFSGRVGKDPEGMKQGGGVRFSVASNERRKDKSGEWKDYVTWMNIQAWAKLGDFAMKHLRKGDKVTVQGKLNVFEYNNKSYTNIVATSIEPSVFRKDGEAPPAQRSLPADDQAPFDEGGGEDDDTPF